MRREPSVPVETTHALMMAWQPVVALLAWLALPASPVRYVARLPRADAEEPLDDPARYTPPPAEMVPAVLSNTARWWMAIGAIYVVTAFGVFWGGYVAGDSSAMWTGSVIGAIGPVTSVGFFGLTIASAITPGGGRDAIRLLLLTASVFFAGYPYLWAVQAC